MLSTRHGGFSRLLGATIFANVDVRFNLHATSFAASNFALCAGHYLAVAYVIRLCLGRVRSLENVCYEKILRMAYP